MLGDWPIYFSNLIGSALVPFDCRSCRIFFSKCSARSNGADCYCCRSHLSTQKNKWLIIPVALVSMTLAVYRIVEPIDLTISEYKSLSRTLNLSHAKVTLKKPGPYGLVEVASSDALRYAPGLSLAFKGDIAVKKEIFSNGDWFGPLVSWSRRDSFHLLDYTTMALSYH
jgi:hypothetical protein